MSKPSFSVVILFYNHEKFVNEAIDSVLGQGRDDVEVIAVDNGATDGTRERLLAYGDRIRTVLWDTNQKASDARNAGAAEATGDYLAFLDGDDAFVPWTIDVYQAVVEAKHPVIIIGEMAWFEGAIPEPGDPPTELQYYEYADYFGKDRPVGASASAIAIERRHFEDVGGWGQSPVEDFDLLWKLGTAGSVVQVMEPRTSVHRSHTGQLSRRRTIMLSAITELIEREKNGVYPGGRARRRERRACVGGVVIHWTWLTFDDGSRMEALRFLLPNASYVATAVWKRLSVLVSGRRALETMALVSEAKESS